jgi:regulator of sigma E protease
MTLFFTIISFVFALGLLIVFHELGHYLVARLCNVKVLRFSVGFGRPLIRKYWGRDQTEWVIAAIPIGGYVKMLDEREGKVAPEDLSRSFNRMSVSRRFAIVSAGPVANFLLAILLYCLLFMHGVSGMKPILGQITPESPAAIANFKAGETLVKIGDEVVSTWQDARWELLSKAVERTPDLIVETLSKEKQVAWRELDLSKLDANDLDADFLKKIGLNVYQPKIKPVIAQVIPNGAGDRAGLLINDEILFINEKEILRWKDLVQQIQDNPGTILVMKIKRNNTKVNVKIVPEVATQNGKQIGKIGIGPKIDPSKFKDLLVEVSYPASTAMVRAINKTWETSVFTLQMLWKMVMGEVSLKNISGPITIADYAGKSAQMGIASYLGFLALISISLGVLNLLPIPLLDGGHLMYYVIEIIKGSPLSERAMAIGQQTGMMLLFTLMVFAIYNDVNRLIST